MVLMESVKQQRTLPSELEVSDRTCTYDNIHICMIIYVLYKGPQGPSDLRSQTTVSIACQHSGCEFQSCKWQVHLNQILRMFACHVLEFLSDFQNPLFLSIESLKKFAH